MDEILKSFSPESLGQFQPTLAFFVKVLQIKDHSVIKRGKRLFIKPLNGIIISYSCCLLDCRIIKLTEYRVVGLEIGSR